MQWWYVTHNLKCLPRSEEKTVHICLGQVAWIIMHAWTSLKHLFLPSNCRWLRCYQRFRWHPGFNVINILLLQMLWHNKMDFLYLAGFQVNKIIATKFESLPTFNWDSLHYMQIIYVPWHFTRNQQYSLFYRGIEKYFYIIDTRFPQLAVLTNWPSVSSMASCDLNGRQTGRMESENSMIWSEIV